MKKLVVFMCLLPVLFFACTTLKNDLSINSHRDQMEKDLSKLEAAVVSLEAAGGAEARRRQSELASARQMIVELEKESAADNDYSGKLIAWSGRLAILEGKYSEAQRLYRQSIAVSPGNVPAIVLSIRLEGDPEKRLTLIEREIAVTGQSSGGRNTGNSGFGELQIERARALFEVNRFSEAAGAYDTAFASGLDSFYRDNYQNSRDRAWELRNTSGASAGTMNMLVQDTVSWNDLINITKNETQLLRFLSGGRNLPEAEYFNRLLERAFIPYIQDITINEWPRTKPDAAETVTRAGAAWYIWHLYAESRADRGLLSRYSNRYATGTNPRSPITDVPPLSPFFDSILGCVETELLGLIDGRNFRPGQSIRGSEILSVLKKLDN
jgi:tetratricopeptide (TPR) repeat protein